MHPRTIQLSTRVCLAVAICALWCPPALCWEKDMHYVLTKWLALKAGFVERDAEVIAIADEDWDEGFTRAAIEDTLIGLLEDERSTLRQMQKGHFPSDPVKYPSQPTMRPVDPGGPYARYLIDKVLKAPSIYAVDLRALGDGLHPFQDSWSHGVISDTPLRPVRPFISPEWMFAHPQTRGGWDRHDADLTASYPKEAMEAALETWKVLEAFAKQSPGVKPSGATWAVLQKPAGDLVYAKDKATKLKAILSLQPAVMSQRDATVLVDHLNDPGSVLTTPGVIALKVLAASQDIADDVRIAVRAKLVDFLRTWFQQRNLDGALSAIDLARLSEQFGGGLSPAQVTARARKLLMMGLVADHGLVNQLGHGNGTDDAALLQPPSTTGPFAVRAAPVQIPIPQQPVFPVAPEAIGFANAFGVALKIGQFPHDAIVLVWQQTQPGQWRIVRLLWGVS